MPTYDRAYFDRWYRVPRTRVYTPVEVERRVRWALAAAEQVLDRPVRRVLDVCCGEGHWQPIIAKLRPKARWIGVDSSPYVVARYGHQRNVRLGRFGELGKLGLRGRFDLIVCVGALYYLAPGERESGLRAIAELLEGVAFLEVFTDRDDLTGDLPQRPASAKRWHTLMRRAGLAHLGMHCWARAERAAELSEFERGRA